MAFSEEELERYSRHIILKGVGLAGQKKLAAGKVLVVGAGGLGAPVLMYLAASGVGTLGIMDDDVVDLSNLQRQIIHTTDRIGKSKAESAAEQIHQMNPHVNIQLYQQRAAVDNLAEIILQYDFVIDAVDNFSSKFLINDACVLAGKPFSHGGIREFHGQLLTYVPGEGPCYRCIFEEVPEDGIVDSCSQAGVLGTLPGIIGSLQALEAQKYLLGVGELLTGQMITFEGLTMDFRKISFPKPSPHCRVCGGNADITQLREENYKTKFSCRILSKEERK